MNRVRDTVERLNSLQDTIASDYFVPYGTTVLYYSFGFIFFYFGLQKPAPVQTPVFVEVSLFVGEFGFPSKPTIIFIGLYEMFLGVLFFLKRIRIVFWLFFVHQFVGFLTLVTIPYVVFQPPWITVFGVDIPWAVGGFSAFVLKNVVWVGAFVVLAGLELGDGSEVSK
ncbi:MAG: hypothetical protein U5J64_05715 [Halobacteriales archaeon]|nr:hypothetical protein [Halobacteriales archaeon]